MHAKCRVSRAVTCAFVCLVVACLIGQLAAVDVVTMEGDITIADLLRDETLKEYREYITRDIYCEDPDQMPSSLAPDMDHDSRRNRMFEVNLPGTGECGDVNPASVMVMEAVRWYIERLNAAGILPFTLGFRGYRTCGDSGLAGNVATDILAKYRTAKAATQQQEFIVGLVGPEYSSEAEVVAAIFGTQTPGDRMLLVSPSATASGLGDRAAYPSFYRVIPDDNVQMETMVQLMHSLDWNRIGIIYVNDSYGRGGALKLTEMVVSKKICVPKLFAIDTDETRAISLDQVNEILNDIVIESPRLVGIVFIGDKHIANQVLQVTNRLSFTDVPIFILPESIELQKTVFQNPSGSILTKSKGAMILSSPFTEITSFTTYWDDLISNSTLLLLTEGKNDFLAQLSSEMLNTLSQNQPVYVKYGILATHAIVKSIKLAYNSICPDKPCASVDDFKQNFKPSDLLDVMDGMNVSMRSDFGVAVEPLTAEGFTMSFSDLVSPVTTGPQYEVYNFRNTGNGGTGEFGFVKVGQMLNTLSLDTKEIRDYGSGGSETAYPDVRRGQCPAGYKCDDCLPVDIAELPIYVPGDIYVIGIVSINNRALPGPHGCGSVRARSGYQMVLSMKFAIEEFSTAIEFSQVRNSFGGRRIGLIVLNDCNNPLEISRKVLILHKNGLRLENAEIIHLENRILGYVGGQSTDVSQPAADQLTQLGIVQVSYSSTNPVLSDKDEYPYFMRIVTPDNVQATAMIKLVKELGGKYIQLVYSAGGYGEGGRDSVLATAQEDKVCIAQVIRVEESSSYFRYIEEMRKKPHAKLVIIFLRSHVVSPFMRDVSTTMERGEFQFVGSEAWGQNTEVLQYDITQGSLTVALEMKRNVKLDTYIRDQLPLKDDVNSRLEEYIQHRQNCYFNFSFDKSFDKECSPEHLPTSEPDFRSDAWCIFVTNTMFSFLEGSGKFFKEKCGAADHVCSDFVDNPAGLVEEMKKVEMDLDGSGKIKLYDDKGDGSMGYKIFNIQGTDQDKSVKHYVEVGSFSIQSGLSILASKVRYPTDAVVESSCPNEQACSSCSETTDTHTAEGSSETTSGPLAYVFGVLFGLSLCAVVILVVILIRQRRGTKEEDPYLTPMTDRPTVVGSSNEGYTIDPGPPQHFSYSSSSSTYETSDPI